MEPCNNVAHDKCYNYQIHLEEMIQMLKTPTQLLTVDNNNIHITYNLIKCKKMLTLGIEGTIKHDTIENFFPTYIAKGIEVENSTPLKTLYLGRCTNLVALPKKVGRLTSLTTLNFKQYSRMVALPKEVEILNSLTLVSQFSCHES